MLPALSSVISPLGPVPSVEVAGNVCRTVLVQLPPFWVGGVRVKTVPQPYVSRRLEWHWTPGVPPDDVVPMREPLGPMSTSPGYCPSKLPWNVYKTLSVHSPPNCAGGDSSN